MGHREPGTYVHRVDARAPVIDPDLLDPFSQLVEITILGVAVHVPEGNRLLRCFQCLAPTEVSSGRFCWNRVCGNSELAYILPGETEERIDRACRLVAVDGMQITGLSRELRYVLRGILGEIPEGAETAPPR